MVLVVMMMMMMVEHGGFGGEGKVNGSRRLNAPWV